jgi:putative phage-type endonuclease
MSAPQGSAEWLAARAGCLTASAIADMLAKTKTGEAASRANLRARLVAERLTGIPQDGFSNAAMQWGNEQEPFARAAYEIHSGNLVDQTGLVMHPSIPYAGASPDGLIDDCGLVEIKCPNTATHIKYLLSGDAPKEYQPQMLWQMECTERKWCDFVSFDPRMPSHLQLFVVRFDRDEGRLNDVRAEAVKFLAEVDSMINQLTKKAA